MSDMIKVHYERIVNESGIIPLGIKSGIDLALMYDIRNKGVRVIYYDIFEQLRRTIFPIAFKFMDIYGEEEYKIYVKNGYVYADLVQ